MKKLTQLLAASGVMLLLHNMVLANECLLIDNPYLPSYDAVETRQNIFDSNGKVIIDTLKQNKADTISNEALNNLLNCMRSSVKLGDPTATIALSSMLIQLAKPKDLTEAYLTRIIANTHQKYDVMSDIKRNFHNLGPDKQVLEMAFKGKTEDDFVEIFSTESHLAVSDIEDLQMAFKDIWDNMPALAHYLLANSKKGSVTEMLGIITLQESSINEFKTHENNLKNHLIIADYVMDHLDYRPSYDFSKSVYETALSKGDEKQKNHAKLQFKKLESFLAEQRKG